MATLRGALSVILLLIGYWLLPADGDTAVQAAPWILKAPAILVVSSCFMGGFVLFLISVAMENREGDE